MSGFNVQLKNRKDNRRENLSIVPLVFKQDNGDGFILHLKYKINRFFRKMIRSKVSM